jgi:hypothetical protein
MTQQEGGSMPPFKSACKDGEERMPLALSDDELAAVMDAAQPLSIRQRDAFLREVASALQSANGEIGPGLVHRVVVEVQRKYFDPPDLSSGGAAGRSKYG